MRRVTAATALLLAAALAAAGLAAGRIPAGAGMRTVHITIHLSHFSPDHVAAAPGETVRFVVQNTDPIDHEFIVGDQHVQDIHEAGTEAYHPPRPGEITVPAGTTMTTTYTFPSKPGSLIFACHLPGHYAYGMRGFIAITL